MIALWTLYDSRYIFCLQIDVKISLVSTKNTISTTKLRKMISSWIFERKYRWDNSANYEGVYLRSKLCKQKLSFVRFVQPGQFDIWDAKKTLPGTSRGVRKLAQTSRPQLKKKHSPKKMKKKLEDWVRPWEE